MSKEKQIEEMAIMLKKRCDSIPMSECAQIDCQDCTATFLYNAGYRKQSEGEWISVEERLPSESGKYIVCTKNMNPYQSKFYTYPENKGGHWGQKDKGRSITHWMPLPKPPKMKGGSNDKT